MTKAMVAIGELILATSRTPNTAVSSSLPPAAKRIEAAGDYRAPTSLQGLGGRVSTGVNSRAAERGRLNPQSIHTTLALHPRSQYRYDKETKDHRPYRDER
jgi:hypothetical protein